MKFISELTSVLIQNIMDPLQYIDSCDVFFETNHMNMLTHKIMDY